jgi:hypothetical protein
MGKKTPGKRCIYCNRSLPLDDFFPHKQWASQLYRDAWCKDCARKFVVDNETLQKYAFENNRKINDAARRAMEKKAQYTLSTNRRYIDPTVPEDEKKQIYDKA